MTLWDLCPGFLYGFVGLASGSAQFSYIENAGQDRATTMALLKNRRIPIDSWGWRLGFTKMSAANEDKVVVATWAFLVKKTQAYWTLQALEGKRYDLLKIPRGAHKYPGGKKQTRNKGRKKKPGWRL